MASIQIRADKTIQACDDFISIIKKQVQEDRQDCEKRNIYPARDYLTDQQMIGFKTVKKIKKLAEYELKAKTKIKWIETEDLRKNPLPPYNYPKITIDHNDFELIGEFL